MLVIRPLAIVEDRVSRGQVLRVRRQPGARVLGLDGDDAAIMTGSAHFFGRVVGDRSEGQRCSSPRARLDHRAATRLASILLGANAKAALSADSQIRAASVSPRGLVACCFQPSDQYPALYVHTSPVRTVTDGLV